LPLKKVIHNLNDVTVAGVLSAVGTNRNERVLELANMADEVVIRSHIQPTAVSAESAQYTIFM